MIDNQGKKTMKNMILVFAAALMTACAPSSVLELREESEPHRFYIDEPYQAAYRKLSRALDHCVSIPGLFISTDVRGNLYPDEEFADLTVITHNMGDKMVLLQAELRAAGAEQTAVTVYGANFGFNDYAADVEYLARNEAPPCP